jgi:AraC-like DNA-binding protein
VLIDDLIDNLALRVEPFAICEVGSPDELVFPPSETVTLHFVLRSTGRFATAGRPPVPIAPYTLVLVPAGLQHSMTTAAASSGARDDGIVAIEGLEDHHVGPRGSHDLVVACGRMRAVYAEGLDLFQMLEDPIVLDFDGVSEMESVFDLLLDESTGGSPGGRAMMTALMNQCLVLVFRRLCDSPECRLPWLAALDDTRLAAVVTSVLENPAADHSLESLSAEAHMSRSAFAREFHHAFGRTPMTFVKDVRLRRGASLLVTSSRSIGEIARRVGFASRSHFSRAFRDYFGVTPSAFRAERDRGDI